MRDHINLITNSKVKREKESTFRVITKFDSRINYEEIWYRSRGLFSTPICVFKI
jgi:hypothetical protein